MEKLNPYQLENQAAQKWQDYTQGILRRYSDQKKQHVKDFWVDYEQLLAQARQNQRQRQQQEHDLQITQSVEQPQATAVATTAEYAYLPWVKLMVPYWDELPLRLQYRAHTIPFGQVETEGCADAAKSIGIVLLCLGALITFAAANYIFFAILLAALIALFTVDTDNISSPKSMPTTYYSYEFSPDHLIYEKKTVYANPQAKPQICQLRIPYETIRYIYTEENGVRILPEIGVNWRDNHHRYHKEVMVNQRIAAFTQVSSFLRDVINANYANKNRKP